MTDQLDSFRGGSFQHIHARAVLALLIHIDRDQPFEIVPEIADHADRLEEHLGQHHGAAQVEPDPVPHRRNHRTQEPEVNQRRLTERGARDMRVHVNDVGAQCDVNRAGNPGAMRSQDQATVGMRAAEFLDVLAQGCSETDLILSPCPGGEGEGVGRLPRHTELSAR